MRRMDVISVLGRVVLVLVGLKLLVWWLEPKMAFFPVLGVQETPAAAGAPFRDLKIQTADGQGLHGWWLEHSAPRAQVIFFHGNGGNLSLWLDVLIELHRRNFNVLAIDYRGYGASTGKASEKGLYLDAEAALRVFNQELRRPGSPVIYWGRSIGASVAAYAGSVSAPDAMVLETPMPEVRAVLRTNPVLWALSFLSSYRFPTAHFLSQYGGPLLVVHGDRDTIIPFGAGRRVFEGAPSPHKQFVVIPGAGHNDLHVVDPTLYWDSVTRFVVSLPRD